MLRMSPAVDGSDFMDTFWGKLAGPVKAAEPGDAPVFQPLYTGSVFVSYPREQ